jgi:hypothetical protein
MGMGVADARCMRAASLSSSRLVERKAICRPAPSPRPAARVHNRGLAHAVNGRQRLPVSGPEDSDASQEYRRLRRLGPEWEGSRRAEMEALLVPDILHQILYLLIETGRRRRSRGMRGNGARWARSKPRRPNARGVRVRTQGWTDNGASG